MIRISATSTNRLENEVSTTGRKTTLNHRARRWADWELLFTFVELCATENILSEKSDR